MITMSRIIAGTRVNISCALWQKPLAEDVLATLEQIATTGELRAGTRVRYGWSVLTLCEHGPGRLLVCEPDFASDPFQNVRPRLDTTLDVIAKQTSFTRRVRVTPVDVGFEQYIVVRHGVLAARYVQLSRTTPSASDDSGWSMFSADETSPPEDPEDFDVKLVYEMLSLRPIVMQVLVLPPGFVVVLDADLITAVFDAEGKERLHHAASG
jgi:hypothetical protein